VTSLTVRVSSCEPGVAPAVDAPTDSSVVIPFSVDVRVVRSTAPVETTWIVSAPFPPATEIIAVGVWMNWTRCSARVSGIGLVSASPPIGERVCTLAQPDVDRLEALELDPADSRGAVGHGHPEACDDPDLDRPRNTLPGLAERRQGAGVRSGVVAVVDDDRVLAGVP